MTNRVLLNNIDHPEIRVIARPSAAFGDSVNQVLIFPTEFEEIQREYPIFFRKEADGAFQAIALLGLDRDENLFLDESGWHGRYVPAVLQRGPFLIGRKGGEADGEPMIHIDLDHPRVSRTEGLPLFLPHGGNAPYLEHVAGVLRVIHAGAETTAPMFAAFEEAGLIEPISIEIQLSDVKKYVLPDLFAIGGGAIAKLDAAWLDRLNRAGYLGLAFYAAASLGNVNRLIELKNRKTGAD
ncbi:MAG: SapC family protein [Sphingomonas bacterium]|uniref:SapC family protein n=1 Tax=Sphingomonas bacterium TaxID=1895847 RepID=UPI0026127D03|nr:SapC family protein [Sphingomonas bacterium]MDB5703645.1 SapC family protein [Sphingomonas bacterium]